MKDKLWVAAALYTEADFNVRMKELKRLSEQAYNYTRNIDPSVWSRSWVHMHSIATC